MSKARELVGNLGIFSLSSLATKFMVFVCLPIYTAYMSSSEYALLDLSQTTTMLLIPILTVSVSDGIIRFVTKDESRASQALSLGIRLLFLSCILLSATLPLIQMFFSDWAYSILFLFFYAVNALSILLSSFCRAVGKVFIVAIASIVSSVVTLLLTVLLVAALRMGLCGYFVASIIGLLAGVVCYLAKVGMVFVEAVKEKVEWSYAKTVLLFSLPLVPNAVFWSLSLNAGKYILAAFAGLSVAGLYSAASKLPAILSTLVSIFQQAWNLAVYKEFDSSEENDGFTEQVFRVYRLSNVVIAVLLIAFSPLLANLFLQGEFYDAWSLMPLLICSMYYSSMSTYYGSIFSASMKTKSLFLTTCVGAFVNIVGCAALIPLLGLWGAVLALVISNYSVYLFRRIEIARNGLVTLHLKMQETMGFLLIGFALVRSFLNSDLVVAFFGLLILLCSFLLFRLDVARPFR